MKQEKELSVRTVFLKNDPDAVNMMANFLLRLKITKKNEKFF
jgi:hypothetical protein